MAIVVILKSAFFSHVRKVKNMILFKYNTFKYQNLNFDS